MSKGLIAVIVVVLILGFVGCGKYNGLVQKDEGVKESWAQVESQYQRRADLIPNLVSTVKGAADFEKSTLTAVIEARSKATQTTINAGELTPENIAKFQGAQDQLSGALSRLLVTVEQYPQLKANQNFLELQAQLEGTENRIGVARNNFNTVVKEYNQDVRTFPNNIFAGIFGFSQKGYFTAAAGSEKAPSVQF
ncbi:LemA family protein [Dyadobacter sp. MSC1_007]|jgi:LemA protein|uniref:LemA family protein n=1 Tax=Dyadobacter sp. MSC1_007 TaxID=2909264 RepID=UPI002030DF3B|nr:LemA family protein [Dyadobacter sp. MSC1_007]